VEDNVDIIEQGRRSGMWADLVHPKFVMADPTTFYSVTWCAASIAHDSYHSKLYHDYKARNGLPVPHDVWMGTEAERKCLKHQLEVLQDFRAPKHEIEHCAAQDGSHHDINKDGVYDWDDFKARNW
jgi:hypothetical protein